MDLYEIALGSSCDVLCQLCMDFCFLFPRLINASILLSVYENSIICLD